MRNLIRGVAIGLAVVVSAQAAQAQMGVSLGAGGGAAVPTGTLGDATGTGWSSQIVARVKPAMSPVGLQLDGFYNRFGWDGGVDGNYRMIGSTANAVFSLPTPGMAHPYFLGGVGVYNQKATITGLGSSDSETKFGANAGAGVDVGVGKRASVFAEGRFHAIFKGLVDPNTGEDKTEYMLPVLIGLRWSLQ
jgi:opacity protein-like surface antigen